MMNVRLSLSNNDIYLMEEVLDILDTMKCPSGVLVDGVEALSVLLKRFAYPCRYGSSIREASSTTLHDYKPNDGLRIR